MNTIVDKYTGACSEDLLFALHEILEVPLMEIAHEIEMETTQINAHFITKTPLSVEPADRIAELLGRTINELREQVREMSGNVGRDFHYGRLVNLKITLADSVLQNYKQSKSRNYTDPELDDIAKDIVDNGRAGFKGVMTKGDTTYLQQKVMEITNGSARAVHISNE